MRKKPKSKFKTYMIVMLLFIAALLFVPGRTETAEAKSKTKSQTEQARDYKLMKKTVCKNYPGKKIKIVNGNENEDKYWNIILHRKNKDYVVVEKVISVGNGSKHGWYRTKDGNKYIIGYNKRVPPGKQITSYIIWNPYSNECDVIDYVIDNGKVR